jgi:predicted DCC family thiol-disulfide oxidoreductase YuxK
MLTAVNQKNRVIYDDVCGFCLTFKKSTESRDDAHQLEFIPFRAADPDDYLPYAPPNGSLKAIIFIDREGHRYQGARAISQILSRISKPWNFIGHIMAFPLISSLADMGYRFFVHHCHKTAGAV